MRVDLNLTSQKANCNEFVQHEKTKILKNKNSFYLPIILLTVKIPNMINYLICSNNTKSMRK